MSDLSELFTLQLESVFQTGVTVNCVLHHGGHNTEFVGVADRYPARLTGVQPGDVRLRARAADLPSVFALGSPDTLQDIGSGSVFGVISAESEFGGAGVCLQLRRVVLAQAGGTVPASRSADGIPGQLVTDGQYLYACLGVNSWVRTAIAPWQN